MADVRADREQLIAELDRIHSQADAKDAADRMRALRDFAAVQDEFDTLYGNLDLVNAHASVLDALGVSLRRAGVALRSAQKLEGERIPSEADAIVDEQREIPTSSVSVAKDLDEAVADNVVESDTHMPTTEATPSVNTDEE